MEKELNNIAWKEPWRRLTDSHLAQNLCKELSLEANPRHLLFGKSLTAIGITGDDDVLFLVHDRQPKLAVVHLTWGAKPDPYDQFPFTMILDSVDLFVAHMASDRDFQNGQGSG